MRRELAGTCQRVGLGGIDAVEDARRPPTRPSDLALCVAKRQTRRCAFDARHDEAPLELDPVPPEGVRHEANALMTASVTAASPAARSASTAT